ncbi:MAG: hypothetical protein RR386_07380 [Bacteroidaceae bacterium]
MKKTYLFLAFFLAVLGGGNQLKALAICALSVLDNACCYLLTNKQSKNSPETRGTLIYKSTSSSTNVWIAGSTKSDAKPVCKEALVNDNNSYWGVYKATSGKYYIYNLGNQKFLCISKNNDSPTTFSSTAIPTTLSSCSGSYVTDDKAFNIEQNGAYLNFAPQANNPVVTWSANDDGAGTQFIKINNFSIPAETLAKIESAILLAEQKIPAQPIYDKIDFVDGYPSSNALISAFKVAYEGIDGAALQTALNAVNAAITNKTLSPIVFDKSKKYQVINVASSTSLEYDATLATTGITNTGKTNHTYDSNSNNFAWGVYISDKTGTPTYFYNLASKTFPYFSNNAYPLSETPTAPTTIKKMSDGAYAITTKIGAADANPVFMHCNNGYTTGIVGWLATSDASQWRFKEIGNVDAAILTTIQTNVRLFESLADLLAQAKPIVTNAGYVGGLDATAPSVASLITTYANGTCKDPAALKQALDAVTTASLSPIAFEKGKKYAIKNTVHNSYLVYNSGIGDYVAASNKAPIKTYDAADENFQWVFFTASDGVQYLYNVGRKGVVRDGLGSYENADNTFRLSNRNGASAMNCTLSSVSAQYHIAAVDGSGNMHNNAGYTAGVCHYGSDGASNWYLLPLGDATSLAATMQTAVTDATTKYEVKINGMGYATFSAAIATTIPHGVEAYYAENVPTTSVLTLTKITDAIVPANQGVILKVTPAPSMDTFYTFEKASATGSTFTNILKNSAAKALKAVANDYVLYGNTTDKPIGFYKAKVNTTIPVNRAYLNWDGTGTGAASILFEGDEEITAIDGVLTIDKASDGKYYNLGGVEVPNPVKGSIYLHNGKTIVK